MKKISDSMRNKLWGETGPYSEIKMIIESRVLDNSISRHMMYMEMAINPFTFEVLQEHIDEFPAEMRVQDLVHHADNRGPKHGYIVRCSPEIEVDIADAESYSQALKDMHRYRESNEYLLIQIHKLVMDIYDLPR